MTGCGEGGVPMNLLGSSGSRCEKTLEGGMGFL
jgi:hypothetical protein